MLQVNSCVWVALACFSVADYWCSLCILFVNIIVLQMFKSIMMGQIC